MALQVRCIRCGNLATRSPCPRCPSPYHQADWRQLARKIKAYADGCAICGSTRRLTAHHRHPRAQGGPDTLENLIALCVDCHNRYEGDKRAGKTTQLTRLVEAT